VSRGTLSQDQIVEATLALVRAEPDGPITMERVASALGTRPMSLYTHIRNRDELLALAAARAWREWDADVPEGARWEAQLRAWCRSLREHVREHPPLLLEMTSRGTFQPALLEAVAVLARILRRAGLDGAGLAEALRWIPQTVLGAIVLELSRPASLPGAAQEAAAIIGGLSALDHDDRAQYDDVLPHFTSTELAELFEYSIDRLVDGVRGAVGA
jgi:AcrR family transcriptional regulator